MTPPPVVEQLGDRHQQRVVPGDILELDGLRCFAIPTHYPLVTEELELFRQLVDPAIEVRVLHEGR